MRVLLEVLIKPPRWPSLSDADAYETVDPPRSRCPGFKELVVV
jgi:hypothetical protein